MIGKIAGRIDYRGSDHLLIDVRGVGYVVYVSQRTLAALPGSGEAVALYTDLLVREDNLQLFGFTTLVEKEWYRLLVTVQGVGAKAAMAILSALGPEGVSRAIALGDWNSVKAAQGVGPKIAQRVVNELKDKAPMVMAMGDVGRVAMVAPKDAEDGDGMVIEPAGDGPTGGTHSAAAQSEALSALKNLGYSPGDAAGAVARASETSPGAQTPELIRVALKLLAPES